MHSPVNNVAAEGAETCGTARSSVRFRVVLGLLPIAARRVAGSTTVDRIVIIIFHIEDDLGRNDFLARVVGLALD